MSGLGAFIQGAFQGYSFGENVKDLKTKRKRDEEDYNYTREQRDWAREDRDYTLERRAKDDEWTDYNRDYTRTQRGIAAGEAARRRSDAAQERGVLDAAYDEALKTWNALPDAPAAAPAPKVADPAPQTAAPASPMIEGGASASKVILPVNDGIKGGEGSDPISVVPPPYELMMSGAPKDVIGSADWYHKQAEQYRQETDPDKKKRIAAGMAQDMRAVAAWMQQDGAAPAPAGPTPPPPGPGATFAGKQANPTGPALDRDNPAARASYRGITAAPPLPAAQPPGPLRAAPMAPAAPTMDTAAPPRSAPARGVLDAMPAASSPALPAVDQTSARERPRIPTPQELVAMDAPLPVLAASREYHERQAEAANVTDPRALERWQQADMIAAGTVSDFLSSRLSSGPVAPPDPSAMQPQSGVPGQRPVQGPMVPSAPTRAVGSTMAPMQPQAPQRLAADQMPYARGRGGVADALAAPMSQPAAPSMPAPGSMPMIDTANPAPAAPQAAPAPTPAPGAMPAAPAPAAAPAGPTPVVGVSGNVGMARIAAGSTDPSVDIAMQTAPATQQRGVLGKDDPIKVTTAQRERAATSFIDHYAQTAVPKLVQHYLSRGEFAKAEALESWVQSREAKSTMTSWAKATHAAAIGDDDAFLDNIVEVYNQIDDGYEVVREQSGFEKDDKGNITSAELTLRRLDTGETFTRRFEGTEDLVEMAVSTFSPEKVFEHVYGQLEAARKIDAENRAFQEKVVLESVKAGTASQQDVAKLVQDTKKFLADSMLPGEWDKLTEEERNARAIAHIRSNQSAAAQLSGPGMPADYTGQ